MTIAQSTVLLVEDDSNDALLLRRAFRLAGIANPIQTVEDGEEAVAYLSGKPPYTDRARYALPALMLLDLKLPRKSGLEVLHWIRQQAGLKRLPVVILTSSRETADINQAYDLGANSYLVKPVAFESLLDVIKAVNQYWMILSERPEVWNHEQA